MAEANTPSPVTKQSLLDRVVPALRADDRVLAVWLGGSDATGRADELSDVDLCIISEDKAAASLRPFIEATVASVAPIRVKFDLPEPTWHGFPQSFYQLENASEYLMVDWIIVERSQHNPWMEVERHGVPRVLFDKAGVIREAHVDHAALRTAAEKKIAELRLKFPLFRHLPIKMAQRGLPVDALHFYNALVLRPLIDLLRAIHCPDRYDFGPRYLKSDLPRQYDDLCRLSLVRSIHDYEWMVELASRLFDAALREHDARSK
ncbi:MAG: nucleotidyltransferase domain-containing protein [Phycisphaerales bacterium]|nr:nucleotidyltransferase domain-containing protein [Phycisphaerales bacterium]